MQDDGLRFRPMRRGAKYLTLEQGATVNIQVSRLFRHASCAVLLAICASASGSNDLGFDQRVACQSTLADISWSETLWPQANKSPKPARREILADAAIRARVENQMRMEDALATLYGQTIDDAALQIELNRMAARSRAPERLQQRFDALGNDARRIAECMVRPYLVQKRLREAYARDARQHGALRETAEAALSQLDDPGALAASGAQDLRLTLVLRQERSDTKRSHPKRATDEIGEIELDPEAFAAEAARLSPARIGRGAPYDAPQSSQPRLRETETGFVYEHELAHTDTHIDLRRVSWSKQGFDIWWDAQRMHWAAALPQASIPLDLPQIHGKAMDLSKAAADNWRVERTPEGRTEHSVVWTGSEMIIWGGYSGSRLDTGGRYNPVNDTWIMTSASSAPTARSDHSAVWTGSEMIVWGGFGNDYAFLATGGRYNPLSDAWTATPTSGAPSARSYHTAVWTGSEMIVWGGYAENPFNTGARYNPVSNAWTAISTNGAPSARDLHTAIWSGSEMIIWGGTSADGSILDTGGRYNPAGNVWTATPSYGAPSARRQHTAVWTGSEMIVWGGDDGVIGFDTGARYNPASDIWIATSTNAAPTARASHTAIWTGSEMIVWGGLGSNLASLDTGARYNPASNTWTSLRTFGAPSARAYHTAVWTGSEMIVWGGADPWSIVHTGARYNPASETWNATATNGAPSPRDAHTAVWTGSEMIVWGGRDMISWDMAGGLPLDTGGRYDPASDTWLPTSTINVPSAREVHTAIWTGKEMIVWGGIQMGTSLDTGGRYNPANDVWLATSSNSAPSARSNHTAIWTGSEMIVWGGARQDATTFDTGGRYDPVSNVWFATPTSGAPQARAGQTAIWTGSEMIVWGGGNINGVLDTGSRYDPTRGIWTATPTIGAPAARSDHTAVWTGSEMIVWGGSSGPALDSGGRYDPASNSWTATSSAGAPSGRYSHSAVWTGSEMIVWGGGDDHGRLNSGARYNPANGTWTATSTHGAPTVRDRHTAIWTGDTMIVWGGCCSFNSMGVYYPYEIPDSRHHPGHSRHARPPGFLGRMGRGPKAGLSGSAIDAGAR